MEIVSIAISRLKLNPFNDRHGPLRDEVSAIQWLLENRDNHMRQLASDLAKIKRLFEYPLVRQEVEDYIVFDGNRRICCIKLILNPKLAPIEKWVDFFSELGSSEVTAAFSEVECEVEPDLEVIDEKLYRRHTGSQEGVGQSQWDPAGKSFFLVRTGKDSAGLGESIERVLKVEGLIDSKAEIPWSNLQRLLSSEPIRKRIGLSFAGGELTYLGDKNQNLRTLQRIANDLSSQKVVLGDLWNNEKKSRYLDRLKADGFAVDQPPGKQSRAPEIKGSETPQIYRPAARGKAPKEKHLIAGVDQNPFLHLPKMERAEKIWRELQFTLEFDDHDNAIAVLMRVLLELPIVYYARQQGIVFAASDNFARRVSAVSDSMLNREFIDARGRSIIRKFESDKPIVSAHSMHQYVHNPNFHPARSDMKAIWNVIRPVIMNSVR
jgi:hypothetical protein